MAFGGRSEVITRGTALSLAERGLKLSANARNCSWVGSKLFKLRPNRAILEWTSRAGSSSEAIAVTFA